MLAARGRTPPIPSWTRQRLLPLTALLAGLLPRALLAHDGEPLRPHDLWSAWSRDPLVILLLALGGWGYARGVRALWRRAGVGRGIRRWQAAAFAGGMAALVIALVSPVHALGEALFAAHMVQHLMLMLVAAPLLALSAPAPALLWALPTGTRKMLARSWRHAPRLRAVARTLAHPLASWTLGAAILWAWHVPAGYDTAVRVEAIHALEHATFFASAFLFWWALVRPTGVFRRARGAALIYLFAAAMQSAALGALLTLAPRPWYAAHLESTAPWGLTPLQDQHIGGGIMWMPASVVYLAAIACALVAWLRDAERKVERLERSRAVAGPGRGATG
ncbi:MAG TPA: cytochrome c oxidase assembly protein [Longimicrobiales bacterium]